MSAQKSYNLQDSGVLRFPEGFVWGAATAAYFISRPHKRLVPPVTGEQLNVARTVLQNAGFSVGVIQVPSKQAVGIVTGDKKQESDGASERLKGAGKKAFGDVKHGIAKKLEE